jgi:hypothetical protein
MLRSAGVTRSKRLSCELFLIICVILLPSTGVRAQEREEPGKPIGKVSVLGNLILMELDKGALGRENLLDLVRHTLRFTPEQTGYRVENLPLEWDPDFGEKIAEPHVKLHSFTFPFSAKTWDSFSVGITGSIRFGEAPSAPVFAPPSSEARDLGGVSIGRFDPLTEGAASLVNTVPAVCVFFKPRLKGDRYVKELADRVVVTWDVTEPYGNIQDFTWKKTINHFQAVLHKDGAIEMSYNEIAARDAIVGVYPLLSGGVEKPLATLPAAKTSSVAAHLDLQGLKLSVVDGMFLKVTFETAGPVLPEGDSRLSGIGYRVYFHARKPARSPGGAPARAAAVWTIRGIQFRNRPHGASRYLPFGPGLSRAVKASSNTISIQGILPPELRGATRVDVSADASAPGSDEPVAQIPAQPVELSGLRNPEVHFSSLQPKDGPFSVLYEAFHYYALPNPRDMACTVIKGLGDKFDFLVYYSDFRVDNQEAGTPSDGPLGAVGGAVTGIGATQHDLASYCSTGRFQWEFIQPVYVGSNQAQERPPEDAPIGTERDITFYQQQLAEISADGKMPPYMYAMSQIAHEMGHRWAAYVSARIGGETIPLGPVHWASGLHAPVAFPYRRPTEASIMGGGVWQDNFDGTYTQLDDDYYVPATGWSYLDLYLMGLISPAEVPDFFILRHPVPAGKDANGHPVFKADRTKVTIQDVIAAEGPRLPAVDKSQRQFNTGMVIVVQHGAKPSRELIERTEAIRKQWIEYFSITTGHRASMTANPR